MNKKLSIVMVLILYAAIAGIPGVLAYLQENNIIVQSHGVSCGSCHVNPGVNTSKKNKSNYKFESKRIEGNK